MINTPLEVCVAIMYLILAVVLYFWFKFEPIYLLLLLSAPTLIPVLIVMSDSRPHNVIHVK